MRDVIKQDTTEILKTAKNRLGKVDIKAEYIGFGEECGSTWVIKNFEEVILARMWFGADGEPKMGKM